MATTLGISKANNYKAAPEFNLDTNSIEASYLNGILTIKFTEEKVKETVKKIKIS